MSATFHRIVVAMSSVVTALTVIWSQTDPAGLGISDEAAAWVAFGLAILSAVATALRQVSPNA